MGRAKPAPYPHIFPSNTANPNKPLNGVLDIISALVIINAVERQTLERVSGQLFREPPVGARRPARRKNPLRLPAQDVALAKVFHKRDGSAR